MCDTSTKVFILEVMGRHAGWIAAAAELANDNENTYVHKILIPEVPFDEEAFLDGVQRDVEEYGYSVIVASEGLKDEDGEFYTASNKKDSFGHSQLGGLAPKLANLISERFEFKNHWAVSDYLQRSARHIASETDIQQAISVGRAAANMALDGKTGSMPIICRESNDPYEWSIKEAGLIQIANKEKTVPLDFISEDGFRIRKKGVEYLRPLIMGESYPRYRDGVPYYQPLDLHLSEN
jgi:6-phosphofructokinase